MGMKTSINRVEELIRPPEPLTRPLGEEITIGTLVRPNGEPVPDHWAVFAVDEEVHIKSYRWKVAHISEGAMLLEPIGPVLVGDRDTANERIRFLERQRDELQAANTRLVEEKRYLSAKMSAHGLG